MSRTGKLPVIIPDNVKVNVSHQQVTVEGPKGSLNVPFPSGVTVTHEGNQLEVQPSSNSRHSRALWGTIRALLANAVKGVVEHFSKDLRIKGVGFQAILKGKILDLKLGKSHPITYPIPEGVTVLVDANTKLKVFGCDRALVGQVAADIKAFYPIEPYKGKGVTIVGEFVRRKEGKKTA